MDMDNILGKIEDIKNKLAQIEEELKNSSVEGTDQNNFVTTTVNGKGEVKDYNFTFELITSLSRDEFVLAIVQATNNALKKAKKLEAKKKKEIVGDVNIPDMPGLF